MESLISFISRLCGKSQSKVAPDSSVNDSADDSAKALPADAMAASESKRVSADQAAPAHEPVPCDQPEYADSLGAEAMPHDEAAYDEKKPLKNERLIAELHKVLEEDKVFLRPDIHIDDVARMLLTNRTYITQLMRQEYGLSFIEYVNVARIQYSQSLLYSSHLSLDDVAEESGFQSTSNYCRAFKRYIGTSPIAWLQKVKAT